MNSIQTLKESLGRAGFKGDIDETTETINSHSHDASLMSVTPKLVLFPRDTEDVKIVVRTVSENKKFYPELSLTARAAGTCMSGGSLTESVILDVSKYMQGILSLSETEARILPGTYYRDFEPEADKLDVMLPCFPASKKLCAFGGMISNNCAGEKTLRWGKMEDYVLEMKVVFSDGNEYLVKPLSKDELDKKIAQGGFEGNLYSSIYKIVTENESLLKEAKPKVSKNSAGYYLWNVWDGTTFDLTRLIVGSQGTFGILTEVKIRLVKKEPISRLFVVFLPELTRLGDIVNDLLKLKPETLESYDDSTMKLAVKFLPSMVRSMKLWNFTRLMFRFIPEAWMVVRGGMPKLVLLVEFSGNDEKEVEAKVVEATRIMKPYGYHTRRATPGFDTEKYWTVRRESFNLLRKHVTGRRTAPFVDDVIVPPERMPEFLPQMREILDEYKLLYTIVGHAGNGNFHIIPLMDMHDESNVRAIDEVSDKVYDLVISMHGSITAEHNDGIVRTPYLSKMFKPEVISLFQKTKDVFDPGNMFNPGKKVGGTKDYMIAHIARE
ncbi:MAG: FAD-binding oxidoreductase [Candidatus Taylorbacteria bacterium CG10_big_fil_rev_8_21_14_0_10_41_48]|uniref:FAD-binding oxidoreductase n=1 Tax=Candidatus Taylorbacteria bacterium CG10_big_fil_rev_8_21_14_0_10_41_48 TaxID=1975024 RepID=A0A2M8LC86_9BACT|nr:MAG: FAD-binding oxidoreductase [Candidatus Taylorbacteria bacterium CG10_big_fil_rev_8_21_14_0_10_41_48]